MGMDVTSRLPAASSIALAGLLALLAGPVAALGLGQIQVRSRPGQPLLAEIPVVSSDPAEMEGLQARLASPETFRRIGLEPPTGAASDLQFAVALDARGNPVIRVTSMLPIQQPLLTFLVEVDWGQGRLVREYSALLDAPRTVVAPVQPIEAPLVAAPNTILRPEPAPVAADAATAVVPAQPAGAPVPAASTAIPPAPAPLLPAPAAGEASAPPAAAEYGPVRRGQTLSQIAGQLQTAPGYTLDQTMLALLRVNPDAFIGDDINKLKSGAVLRVPQAEQLSQYSASQAAAVVREQIANWRAARRPMPQPAAGVVAKAASDAVRPASGERMPRPRQAQARLEIVPPSSSDGRRAGTRSGIDAGGEGNMLRQQLQETRETLAARDAEVQELKTRVADLEKLQQQQQQLLTMKDSELAAAQQNLARTSRAATPPAAPTAQAQQPVPAPPAPADRGATPWLWAGVALVVLGLLAAWLARRRRRRPPPVTRAFDTATLAASMPTALVAAEVASGQAAVVAGDAVEAHPEAPAARAGPDAGADPRASGPGFAGTPAWVGAAAAPPWHAGAPAAALPVAADAINASQQLQLARAYLDLGDDDAARELLREVLDGRDPAARTEAARLLRDL